MDESNNIIPGNLKIAIGIINGYICEYERPYEFGTDSKEWQRNKRDYQNRLIAGVKILSAVTGNEYHWTQREMKNGKLYSAVCQIENGIEVDVYNNCARGIKGDACNG